ncbi:MAG: conserved membrane protein of unknown function [Promethearchaeota archaeon]|nr:MAG: conserved membrane protein of unknown function [Candidatus Lokiarchaeota archaeon]
MVSLIGWLDGLTASAVIFMAIIFGILSFYQSKKLGAKLLGIAGIMMIFSGLLYLGPFIDFMSLVSTGTNMDNSFGLYGILSYFWITPAIIPAMYLGAEMIIAEKKWIIVGIIVALGIVFELLLFIFPNNTFDFVNNNPGEVLIDASFNILFPTFFLAAGFLIAVLIFLGGGFAMKAKQASGELKRKFIYLSVAFITFVASGIFEALLSPGIGLFIVRSGMIIYAALVFLGLKT